jgi:hypothetical protein
MPFLLFFACILVSFSEQIIAQDYNHHNHSLHAVEFSDKKGTPYSLLKPQEYLSARALQRREVQGIEIDDFDLPISPTYIDAVLQKGVTLHGRSKWMNSLSIHCSDSSTLASIATLPFVRSVYPLGKFRPVKKPYKNPKKPRIDRSKHEKNYYGQAANQIKMLGGDLLHKLGFTGKDVQVAILDGGFLNVYRMPVFDSLFDNNRLLGSHDFVEGDEFVYESSGHGCNVLSCMGAKAPNLMVGTAPDASYYLFKTEDVKGEFRIEEFNWVAAIEYADSVGVDVVNSSLGYTGFNDTTMSYRYEQLDGQTALSSRGANIGASKGLIIVNSAGNEGDGPWHYIGTPADAPGVLSVAAVRPNGKRASFSSWGPTADGRVKPDVAAQGRYTVVASMNKYDIVRTNGTSFSSPVLAGMVASLRGAFPDLPSETIKNAIKFSGSMALKPDSSLGYGIPNFLFAYISLLESSIVIDYQDKLFYAPTIVKKNLHLFVEQQKNARIDIKVYNTLMQQQYSSTNYTEGSEIKEIKLAIVPKLKPGIYIVHIQVNKKHFWLEVIKE